MELKTLIHLDSDGLPQSAADHFLFTRTIGSSLIVVLLYVDDIILAGNDLSAISHLKVLLDDRLKIKDLSVMNGLEVDRSPIGTFVYQLKYTLDILVDFGNLGSRPASFPMDQNLKLNLDDGVLLSDPSVYR